MKRLTSMGLLLVLTVAAQGDVVTDFETGTFEGWTEFEPFNGTLFVDTPGHPGFSLQATDDEPGGGPLLARAPASYRGDLSGMYGIGWHEWLQDIEDTVVSTSCELRGPDGTTYRSDNTLGPAGTWVWKIEAFTADNWTLVEGSGDASFEEVLSNVDELLLHMDVTLQDHGILESRLDNITLFDDMPTPVESHTWGRIKASYR